MRECFAIVGSVRSLEYQYTRQELVRFEKSIINFSYSRNLPAKESIQGVGAKPAATQAAIQAPRAALHPMTATGALRPAVMVPKVTPAAA